VIALVMKFVITFFNGKIECSVIFCDMTAYAVIKKLESLGFKVAIYLFKHSFTAFANDQA